MAISVRLCCLLMVLRWALPAQDSGSIPHFESLIQMEHYAQAAEQLDAYTRDHPDSWQAFYQLGYADFRLHRIQASVSALCRSLVLNKNAAEPHKILAYDLNMLGRQSMAIHELREAIRCDALNIEAHYELGRILYEQGRYVSAAAALEQARSLAPGMVRVYHNLGLAYAAQGEAEKAVQSFEEGLRRNSLQPVPSAWPLIDYATYLNMQSEFSRARDLLLPAIQMDSSEDRAFSELAKAYRGLDQPDQAIAALRRAIAISSSNAEYHYVLGRLYAQTHQPKQAEQELAQYERCKAAVPR